MTWTFQLAGVHLVNQSGAPVKGGSPLLWHTTPFALMPGWTPAAAKPKTQYAGGSPLSNGSRPVLTVYDNVPDTIPIMLVGNDALDVADALQILRTELSTASQAMPAIWRHRPVGALFDLYAEVYEGTVQEKTNDAVGPIEGGADLEIDVALVRSPFFGTDELLELFSQTFTNTHTGNVVSFGSFIGDLQAEGQPLNIRINKPVTQDASTVYLASVLSRTQKTITNAQSTPSTTTGLAFTASGSIDVSPLRRQRGVSLHLLARLTSLTLPAQAQVQATVKTAAGNTLWLSGWRDLGSDVTAQLIDLGDTSLDMLRVPIAATTAANITVTLAIRSTTGATVGATLDYIEALLVHDFCVIECAAGLSSGQHYDLFGAQNMNGGGWLPLLPETGAAFDASDVQTNTARIRGQLPRAFRDASLYVAWVGATKNHTASDTATITASVAPLWRTLRGGA